MTSMTREGAPCGQDLNVALEQLKFMEFSLEGPKGAPSPNAGAWTVNLPAPERFVSQLIVYGERPIRVRTKATKALLQAAAIIEWCLENGRGEELKTAWDDALGRPAEERPGQRGPHSVGSACA